MDELKMNRERGKERRIEWKVKVILRKRGGDEHREERRERRYCG